MRSEQVEIKELFEPVRQAIINLNDRCREAGLDLRFVCSFFLFLGEVPIADYTSVFGRKDSVLKVLDGLKENLEMEPGGFLNV